MLRLDVKNGRAVVLKILGGRVYRVASFSADGYVFWRDLFGSDEIDDSWGNLERVAKAFIFAKAYPYARDKHRLVKLLREMSDYEATYWMLAIKQHGQKAISAFKKLYDI